MYLISKLFKQNKNFIMVVSLYLRNFKIYQGINFIPLSTGSYFSSVIGENGVGKSSVLEALDFVLNKKDHRDWPINNEAKSIGALTGTNIPFISTFFLIKKDDLRKSTDEEKKFYKISERLSDYFWETTYKTKAKGFDEFYEHRKLIELTVSKDDYFFVLIGKRLNDKGIYFSSFHTHIDFYKEKDAKYEEDVLQEYFKGYYDYIISHYNYLHIPVETDVNTYTKLERSEMQKLMDKDIRSEIEKVITGDTVKKLNKDLDKFVSDIENTLGTYKYKGFYKDSLKMPDLVSKIFEAYFSIKILHRKGQDSKLVPVYNLSSGEKRKALIDVAYSFLIRNDNREKKIIIAIDEPDASLHISACYQQFERLMELSSQEHQVLISTHWYGYLPIVSRGSATSIQKDIANEINITYFDLYNYREQITQTRKTTRGSLPYDINLKSYNDLVQSIVFSLMQETPYNWIICEGLSEKIYFEDIFDKEISQKNLRILPMGGFKEVKKVYSYLISPINDPDYTVNGKVCCIVDTDIESFNVDNTSSNKNLSFERLLNSDSNGSTLVEVNSNVRSPTTEIEDCLDPLIYIDTLLSFAPHNPELNKIFEENDIVSEAKNSSEALDLKKSDIKLIKDFFDGNNGYNKILFARKYVELRRSEKFASLPDLRWISELKKRFKSR